MKFGETNFSFVLTLQELDCLYDDHFGRHSDGLSAISNCSSVSNETEDALDWDDTEDVDGTCLRNLEDRIHEIIVSEREDEEVEHIEDEGEHEDDDECFTIFTIADFECRCSVSCISQFEQSEIQEHIMNICEMTKEEKDMYLMGVLQPIGVSHTKTWRGERKRKRYGYTYGGKNVCRSTFQYIFNIGRRALTSLITHMNVNGKVPRIHGNKGRKPHNSLKYNEIKHCVDFVLHYSNEHGLPQPAAPRGRDGEPPVYLPASLTKYSLHKEYVAACQEINIRTLGLSSFKSMWLQCLPHIRISNPRDDVCQTCEIIRKKISDAVSEEEKLTASTELSTHIEKAQLERGVYKQSIKCAFDETPPRDEGAIPPVSKDLHKIHYTFDFSQQVTIPHHYRQMGPLYFMTPRRVQLFGVRLDGASLQYNYLIDEDQTIGKT